MKVNDSTKQKSMCVNYLQEFHKDGNNAMVDQQKLPVTVTTRYIRFRPTQQQGHNCLRVEVYGTESKLTFLISVK